MQLTIEVPDDQVRQLGLGRAELEKMIGGLLRHIPCVAFLEEVTEFLGRGPQPEEIVSFHCSEGSQRRVRELLEKNRAGALTPEEEKELDGIESINHLFALIRARAWQHLPAAL